MAGCGRRSDRFSTEIAVSGYTGALYVPNVRDLGGKGADSGGSDSGSTGGSTGDGAGRGPDLDDGIPF